MFQEFDNPLPRRDFLKLSAVAAGSTLALGNLAQAATKTPAVTTPKNHPPIKSHQDVAGGISLLEQETVQTVTAKNYSHLLGKLDGISENQLKAHFKLYEGYVNKINLLHQLIAKADEEALAGTNPTYAAYREMHVEQSYAHNGVVLHEMYFGNLGAGTQPSSEVKAMINRSFGSWDNYVRHLIAVGKSMRGWAITGFDMRTGHLRNFGLDLHNQWSPMHFYPVLVLDVYEHAYFMDYGTERAKYLDAFLKNVDWNAVQKRLLFAVHHLSSGPASTV